MLSVPRLLRLQRSLTITTTSSYKMAPVLADKHVAPLKVSHIEKQLSLEHEETELRQKRERDETELRLRRDCEEAELVKSANAKRPK